MKTIQWYFDFVSPYSYLQHEQLIELQDTIQIEYHPVLFAGLLNHWGHKGPAEIPEKRLFTYRSVLWSARRMGIPFRFPRAHPFNPLPLLRLCIALDSAPGVVRDLFRFVWREGKLPEDADDWSGLLQRLRVTDADALIQSAEVKNALRDNTERAAARGVFGVPTAMVDDELFWGVDLTGFLLDYINNPDLLADPEMRRVSDLPATARRKT